MPTFLLVPVTGRYLSFEEREETPPPVEESWSTGRPSRSGKAELMARRPRTAKLVANGPLREYVQERLSGQVLRPSLGAARVSLGRNAAGIGRTVVLR